MTIREHTGRAGWGTNVPLLAAFVALVVVGGAAGCGIGLTGASTGTPELAADAGAASRDAAAKATTPATVTTAGGATPPAMADAGGIPADAVTTLGSPLCSISTVCSPDEVGCTVACAEEALGEDAGAAYVKKGLCNQHGFACHVSAVHGEGGVAAVTSACTESRTTGTGEVPCQSSDDCAATFECVIDDAHPDAGKAGVCRRYCCADVCTDSGSFCDIETEIGGSVAVPVCVDPPASGGVVYGPCQLLKDSCPSGLACQIVDQRTGLAACVRPGSSTAGQSCETEKCAAGFSCIGQFPYRQCAELCNVDDPNTCVGGTCTQNTALSSNDSVVGVCAQ